MKKKLAHDKLHIKTDIVCKFELNRLSSLGECLESVCSRTGGSAYCIKVPLKQIVKLPLSNTSFVLSHVSNPETEPASAIIIEAEAEEEEEGVSVSSSFIDLGNSTIST